MEITQHLSSTVIIIGVTVLLFSSLLAITNKKLWVLDEEAKD
jgi:hypothetical protein